MIDFFRALFESLFPKKYDTGLREDPRGYAERDRDYLHEERELSFAFAGDSAFSNTKPTSGFMAYENQQNVGSCVPHGVFLALEIERLLDSGGYARLSKLYPYRKRLNYPTPGSWLQDMFNIGKEGSCFYSTLPTKAGMTEDEATAVELTEAMKNEAALMKGKNYFSLERPYLISEVAKISNLGHGVPILIYATYTEWARDYPLILDPKLDPAKAAVRHCVCVLPNSAFTENGVRYVAVQDSAWFGDKKLRYLSDDFFSARVFGAGYWDTVEILATGQYPKYVFNQNLTVGSRGHDVVAFQKLLIAEGMLPKDCATGYFGGITLAGLHAFQTKYADKILTPGGFTVPTDIFGPASRAVANSLCR